MQGLILQRFQETLAILQIRLNFTESAALQVTTSGISAMCEKVYGNGRPAAKAAHWIITAANGILRDAGILSQITDCFPIPLYGTVCRRGKQP